jgi:hypothetical protein
MAGGGDFALTVSGTNFASDSIITFKYNALPTTFVSATELKATVPASYIAIPGQVPVLVLGNNPPPQTNFDINYPAPVITSLVPSHVQAGAAPIQLTLKGTGLFDSSTVKWNGVARLASLSSSQLVVALSANDVAAAGNAQVSVSNPAPGGGNSAPANFTVDPFTSNPAPVVSSLSATRAPAGWPGIPLLIKGSGFVAATTMQWNGSNRPSTPLSSSLLKTGIPIADLANSGNALINIFTTGPGGGTSSVKPFIIDDVATDAVGVVERSSVSTDLTEADSGVPTASMSANGRYIVFSSSFATNPAGGTSNHRHAFLRDTCVGAAAGCTPSLSLISQNDSGQPGDSESYDPFISATGRFVVFGSYSSNLVPRDTSGADIFVRDTCIGVSAGCTPTTKKVSADNSGSRSFPTNASPSVSKDGRFVAFTSGMSDYYTKTSVINLRDTCTGAPSGCSPKASRIDVGPGGVDANGFSFVPIISSSGRYVAFESSATNLVTPNPVSGEGYVFLRDTCLGASGCTPSTTLVSVDRSGSAVGAQLGAMSSDGRFVVFDSKDGNIVPGDMNGFNDVFVRDTCNGGPAGCVTTTTRVSLADDGSEGNGHCYGAAVRDSIRFIAFSSDAANLITGDSNNNTDVFLRDTCVGATAGCAPSTVRLSVALDGTQGNNKSLVYGITDDGHYVAVISEASNLAPGDTNAAPDVFLARTNVP